MALSNIPVQLTRFIGRARELEDVKRLLSTSRLVTLAGSGGCGKTRLALQMAKTASSNFKDGVWLVELAPVRDPVYVSQLLTKILDIPHRSDRPVLESLLDHLQSKELLLVLDNCEHLINGCAQLAHEILSQTSEVHMLVTSREPLAIAGETVYPVSGLELPPIDKAVPNDPQDYMQYDSVRLFLERARTFLPHFAITPENAASLVQICRRLDGLPLALELASVHTPVLSLQEILARLDARFTLLVSNQRSEPDPRHRTLRAAIDWSYDMLSPAEQVMLQRLAVFSGGCSLTNAETVCAEDELEHGQVLGLLSSLVNKSLVVAQTLQGSEARYSLLETIRQYAQEKLIDRGEWSAMRDRHLQCFVKLVEEIDLKLRGEYQRLWLNWLDIEYDNVRAALAWVVEAGALDSARVEAGLRIVTSLYQFWRIRDYVEEGLDWCRQLFNLASEGIHPIVRANALTYASLLAGIRGQVEEQMQLADQAVLFGQAAGGEGKKALAYAYGAQGYAARKAGDHQTAFDLGMREIGLLRELGDRYMLGVTLSLNSFAALSIGDHEQARIWLDEGLPMLREVGDVYRLAMALNYLGDLDRCELKYAGAQTRYEEAISLLRKIDANRDLASALHNLGHACLHLGDVEQAKARFSESMALHQEQDNQPGVTECLLGFAALAIVGGLPADGARLLASAAAIGGRHITREWAATRMEYEYYLERARTSLTDNAFQAEEATGQRYSLEQAARYAEIVVEKIAAAQRTPGVLEPLTARECEVVAYIAQAKSNAEIAAELVVSKRTVESHIASIRSKLGFTERAQIVRWAIESGLDKTSN